MLGGRGGSVSRCRACAGARLPASLQRWKRNSGTAELLQVLPVVSWRRDVQTMTVAAAGSLDVR